MSTDTGAIDYHPEFLAMEAVIYSDAGKAAAMKAASKGLPALAGVDQLLTDIFARYRDKHHYTLKNAGFIVAKLMRDRLGYSQGSSAKCPSDCSAANGTMFYPPDSN